MSALNGKYTVEIDGRSYTMRFSWDALSEVMERFGDAPNLFNVKTVAAVAALGLREHHPEITEQRLLELSPPLVPLANATQKALHFAYFGNTEPLETEKKTALQRVGGLLRLIARR